MKIIVIGAVAAGTSAATKARRNTESAEIIIYEKDEFISYSACGMPYFLGQEVEDIQSLTPRDPAFFQTKYNIAIKTRHEVLNIHPDSKTVTVKNLETGDVFQDSYDKLVLATGATSSLPPIKGIQQTHVFSLRTIGDSLKIHQFLEKTKAKQAVVVGSGFIGLELVENLVKKGISVTLIEKNPHLTPHLDQDMALFLENTLKEKDIPLYKSTTIEEITPDHIRLSSGEFLPCDCLLFATGVRPNTTLAKEIGITLGDHSAISVTPKMETNLPDIYACGDCIETFSAITGKNVYHPLGTTANKTGRIAGDAMTGGNLQYKGNLGTSIFRFFNKTVASTGLTESQCKEEGYEIELCHNIKPHRTDYFQGKEMVIKAIAHKETDRLLGVQIIGTEGVDKRIDVFATLITYKATVDELFHLDLAYAPPFSTTKDPVHYTGMILDNALHHGRPLLTTQELQKRQAQGEPLQIIDTRCPSGFHTKGSVENAINIPQTQLREAELSLDKKIPTVTYCNKGVTGNASQNILINQGFETVYNLSGGHQFYKATTEVKQKENKENCQKNPTCADS